MITIKDYMTAIDYKITEGSEYCWKCFGPNAHILECWDGEVDGHTVSIVFDTRTQEVYMAEAYDYEPKRAYRLINPDFKDVHQQEVIERGVEDVAWDDVRFTDLEVDADWLEKARAIAAGEDYDTRVQIELDLDNDLLLRALKAAHEMDITFNEFVELVLREELQRLDNEHK